MIENLSIHLDWLRSSKANVPRKENSLYFKPNVRALIDTRADHNVPFKAPNSIERRPTSRPKLGSSPFQRPDQTEVIDLTFQPSTAKKNYAIEEEEEDDDDVFNDSMDDAFEEQLNGPNNVQKTLPNNQNNSMKRPPINTTIEVLNGVASSRKKPKLSQTSKSYQTADNWTDFQDMDDFDESILDTPQRSPSDINRATKINSTIIPKTQTVIEQQHCKSTYTDVDTSRIVSLQSEIIDLLKLKVELMSEINLNLVDKNLSENDKLRKNSELNIQIAHTVDLQVASKTKEVQELATAPPRPPIGVQRQETAILSTVTNNEYGNSVQSVKTTAFPPAVDFEADAFSDDSDLDKIDGLVLANFLSNKPIVLEEKTSLVVPPMHFNGKDKEFHANHEMTDFEEDEDEIQFTGGGTIENTHPITDVSDNNLHAVVEITSSIPDLLLDDEDKENREPVVNSRKVDNIDDLQLLQTPEEERDDVPNTQDQDFLADDDDDDNPFALHSDGDYVAPSEDDDDDDEKTNNTSFDDDVQISQEVKRTNFRVEHRGLKSTDDHDEIDDQEPINIEEEDDDVIENDSIDVIDFKDSNFNDEREIVKVHSEAEEEDDDLEMIDAVDFSSTHRPIEILPKIEFSQDVAALSKATDVEDLYPWSKEVRQKLNAVFKLSSFRSNQLEAINATLRGKDVFVLMPTGGGKSLCYQLPAVVKSGETKGTTIVISPLISLMQDQVQHLKAKNIQAAYINSKGSAEEKRHTFSLFVNGYLDLVYLSPEMISISNQAKNAIRKLYDKNMLARIVVDEAHCVSSWGHDFRPDYQALKYFKETFSDIPIMALTATANEHVRLDIVHNLKMTDPEFFKQSFNRTNLFYQLLPKTRNYVEDIKDLISGKYKNTTGIIYCHSKNACEQVASLLQGFGIKSAFYHAGMSPDDRLKVQMYWQQDKIKVICATIAFGMGIDKPDVRYVIHATLPRTLEGYYQETGRAGRDGKDSDCILFYAYHDARLLINLINRDKELDHAAKEKHMNKLKQVIQYCENSTDCRRQQVLQYFNESFERADCKKKCDNCVSENKSDTVVKDVTEHAKNIVQLIKSIQLENVTLIYCQDIYRGSKSSKIMSAGHDKLPYHGLGKEVNRNELQRIFFHLITLQHIVEFPIMNKSGFANNYVRIAAAKCRPLLNNNERIKMSFSVENNDGAKSFLNGNVSGSRQNSRAKMPKITTAKDVLKQNRFSEFAAGSSGYSYTNSSTSSASIAAKAKTTRKKTSKSSALSSQKSKARTMSIKKPTSKPMSLGKTGPRTTKSSIGEQTPRVNTPIRLVAAAPVNETPFTRLCFDELRALRNKKMAESNLKYSSSVYSDETLRDMAFQLPLTKLQYEKLKGVTKDSFKITFPAFKPLILRLRKQKLIEHKEATDSVSATSKESVSPFFNRTKA